MLSVTLVILALIFPNLYVSHRNGYVRETDRFSCANTALPYPVPLYRGFLRALGFLSVTMHLHRFANLLLIDGVRLEGEHRRISHEHLHRPGTSLRALRVVRRAGVPTLMILVHPCKEQGAIVHHHDILRLIRLEQSFVLCPRHVLKGGICFYVTMNHAGQTKRQVLHRRSERDLRWIWNGEDLIKIHW